jgi:excinuclease ABC subunit A
MSDFLEVIWANTHNLKNVNIKIPKNKITVITWVSWSGKSSLAFNTIYNVWQQKYLESLSSYARMFIWWMSEEAKVDEIKWLSPTISIDQKTTSKNPRSTVWTITEIYDYYRLLYLNVWERKCVKCNNVVKKDSLNDIINYLSNLNDDSKFMIKIQLNKNFNSFDEIKKEVLEKWFIRFSIWTIIYTINDKNDNLELDKTVKNDIYIIIDRLVKKDYLDNESTDVKRLKDSLELAFRIWKWILSIEIIWAETKQFSNIFVCSKCWHIPSELTISSFSFNSHFWACQDCHWLWVKKLFLEEKITNFNLTLLEGAIIAPWFWWNYFFALLKEIAKKNKLDLYKKYSLLSREERDIVLYWTGNKVYKVSFENEYWESKSYNSKFEWVINTLTRRYFDWWLWKWVYDDFVIDMDCLTCNWYRLNNESLSVFLSWINIWELSNLSVKEAIKFLKNTNLSKIQEQISKKILKNAIERLEFLLGVWLDYMTISRKAWTLSWWEAQRIRLATQIWTKLEWIIYVLDEPSIWLHPRDNNMLINNLKKLRDLWNTLIIVEHDEDIMKNSDYIIDIWPWAWIHGWEIVAKWTLEEIINNPNSITWPYLNENTKKDINHNRIIKRWFRPNYDDLKRNNKVLEIIWAKQNNLKNINVSIPLSNFIVVTWVSWSWKSSLVNDILANYLSNKLNRAKKTVWLVKEITWLKNLDKTVIIDQSPIWKTPRSNPATYTWVFTSIREVFALSEESQIRWFNSWRFSFNTKQWRCLTCDWDWVKKIEMHFLPPVYIECESCNWKRYNSETLKVKYRWKNIADILNMTIEEWFDFFSNHPKIIKILKTLIDVWLWYIKLWQSSTTLSWWEAQRVKLSTELSKKSTWKTFYILDEPTTWLHFQDVDRLLTILHSLVDKWNTVLVIEHNMDVIINADYIIDIWLEWWKKWWELIWFWTLEDIKNNNKSYTWIAINKYLN